MAYKAIQRIYKPRTKVQTLGGSLFIRNAIQFDYCVAEALDSLCAVCDKAVVLDASSTDGTLDLLMEVQKRNTNLRVVSGAQWECAENFDRLRILANAAKSYLQTDWHFMLQADEVIHESSFPAIRKAILSDKRSVLCRRCNLFGDLNHYLKYDIAHEHKPCSDMVVRLATIENEAYGDAESIQVDPAHMTDSYVDKITIFHYGFVRRDAPGIDKVLSMQSWFWGPGSQPDSRVVEMSQKGTRYEWELMKKRELLDRIPMEHPRFSKAWADLRQSEKIPVPPLVPDTGLPS